MSSSAARAQRLYSIQNEGEDFYAGTVSDGCQVLMGLLCPDLVVVFFDPYGRFLETKRKGVDVPRLEQYPQIYAIHDLSFRERLSREVDGWQRELGFKPSGVRVQQFSVADLPVGIFARPESFELFLANPDDFFRTDERARRAMYSDIERWDGSGRYVLLWGKEYWMTPEGEVEST